MAARFRPSGTSISGWLEIAGGPEFESLRQTLAIIDGVHGDGDLPRLPVRMTGGRSEIGGYRFSGRDGRPLRLEISRHSDHPHLTVAHEVGHFLDHQALGAPGHYASESGRIGDVMDAVRTSAAMNGLLARVGRKYARVRLPDGSLRQHEVAQQYVGYLLRPSELFSRAYAQYVAVRSQDAILRQQLDGVRRALLSGTVYHTQWDDEDFDPIAEALDRLMRRRGWIR